VFRVRWGQQALDQLANLWTGADSAQRQAITTACHTLEQVLRRNAPRLGESRFGRERITFMPPLGIIFRVEADGRTVSVLHAWVVHQRPR
jgi:hypothetical protein